MNSKNNSINLNRYKRLLNNFEIVDLKEENEEIKELDNVNLRVKKL